MSQKKLGSRKASKQFVYYGVTVPYRHNLGKMWDDAKRFIDWCYSTNKRDHSTLNVPKEIRGDLDSHTENAMLFILGNRTRSATKGEYFLCFFGKRMVITKDQQGYWKAVNSLLGITFPAFDTDAIENYDSLRWCMVYEDRIFYKYRVTDPEKAFNISMIPNLPSPVADEEQ